MDFEKNESKAFTPPPCSIVVIKKKMASFKDNNGEFWFVRRQSNKEKDDRIQDEDDTNVASYLPKYPRRNSAQKRWKEGLANANQQKLGANELIEKWLESVEPFDLEDRLTEEDFMSNSYQSEAEVIWKGDWGAGKRNSKEECKLCDNRRTKSNGNSLGELQRKCIVKGSIESFQDDSLASSFDKQTESRRTDESIYEDVNKNTYDVQKLLRESENAIFVSLCCENIIDEELKDRINKRRVSITHKETDNSKER